MSREGAVTLRRLLALGLVLGLGVFGLETAIHSVHHLSEQTAPAHCNGATTFAHVSAAGGGSPAIDCPPISVRETRASGAAARVEAPLLRANRVRAPPATNF